MKNIIIKQRRNINFQVEVSLSLTARGTIFEVFKIADLWEGTFIDYHRDLKRISHVTMKGFETKEELIKEAKKSLYSVMRVIGKVRPGSIDTFKYDNFKKKIS